MLEFISKKHDYYTVIAMQQNSSGQSDPVVQQDTLVYADIGPSSLNKKAKHGIAHAVTDDMDDRVEYALLNHHLQEPVITTNHSIAGKKNNLQLIIIL